MNMHEYMLCADGSIVPVPGGVPTAHMIAEMLIEHQGMAYFWPGSAYSVNMKDVWYVMLPIFEHPGGHAISTDILPDVIKLAVMLG